MWLCVSDYSTAVCLWNRSLSDKCGGHVNKRRVPVGREEGTRLARWPRGRWNKTCGERRKVPDDTATSDLTENSRCDIERNVMDAESRKITGKHREVIFLPQISVCWSMNMRSKQKYHEISPTEVHAVTLSWAPSELGELKVSIYAFSLIPLSLRGTENLLMALFQSPDEASYNPLPDFVSTLLPIPPSHSLLTRQNYPFKTQITSCPSMLIVSRWLLMSCSCDSNASAKFMRVSQPNPCPFHSLLSSPWSLLSQPQPHGASCDSTNPPSMHLPQGLSAGCSLCLRRSDLSQGCLRTSLKSMLICFLLISHPPPPALFCLHHSLLSNFKSHVYLLYSISPLS